MKKLVPVLVEGRYFNCYHFKTVKKANDFLVRNTAFGVIGESRRQIIVARNADKGVKQSDTLQVAKLILSNYCNIGESTETYNPDFGNQQIIVKNWLNPLADKDCKEILKKFADVFLSIVYTDAKHGVLHTVITLRNEPPKRIETLKKGDYFRFPGQKKVRIFEGWCRTNRAYHFVDTDDVWGAGGYKKKGQIVETDFEY